MHPPGHCCLAIALKANVWYGSFRPYTKCIKQNSAPPLCACVCVCVCECWHCHKLFIQLWMTCQYVVERRALCRELTRPSCAYDDVFVQDTTQFIQSIQSCVCVCVCVWVHIYRERRVSICVICLNLIAKNWQMVKTIVGKQCRELSFSVTSYLHRQYNNPELSSSS